MVVDVKIAALRRRIESLEASGASSRVGAGGNISPVPRQAEPPPLGLGQDEVDDCFRGGGLGFGSHQFAGSQGDGSAAKAIAIMLLARYLTAHEGARALVVQETSALREGGAIYGPGLHALGLDPGQVIFVEARDGPEALRAVNEALRVQGPTLLIADLHGGSSLVDLSATRRFNLAARKARALVLIATPDLSATSAALTRWRVSAAPSLGRGANLGTPTFRLELVRNRQGRTGAWTLEWNSHDRIFRSAGPEQAKPVSYAPAALAASVVAPAVDRSGQAGPPVPVRPFGAYRQTG